MNAQPSVAYFAAAALLIAASSRAGEQVQGKAPAAVPQVDEHGHGVHSQDHYDPRDFTAEQRERIERLFRHVICACPRENFTKTLAGCPDECANRQKGEIRSAVKAGKTDQEIFDEQVRAARTHEVLSVPDSALAHYGPSIVLGVLALSVACLLSRSLKRSAAGGPKGGERPRPPTAKPGSDEERLSDAVDRDLAEMDG